MKAQGISRVIRFIAVAMVAAVASCAPSHWDSAYVGVRPAAAPKPAEPVQVRSVAWERIDATLQELDKQAAASDVAPDDWPAEKKAEAHAALLRGLQVKEDPRRVEMLGRSEFATTSDVRPDKEPGRGQIVSFAEKIGADTVVWSSRALGVTDVVVDRPVTTYGTGQAWFQDRSGRWHSSIYTTSETTWVPMHTTADRFAYMAFFMRVKD